MSDRAKVMLPAWARKETSVPSHGALIGGSDRGKAPQRKYLKALDPDHWLSGLPFVLKTEMSYTAFAPD